MLALYVQSKNLPVPKGEISKETLYTLLLVQCDQLPPSISYYIQHFITSEKQLNTVLEYWCR